MQHSESIQPRFVKFLGYALLSFPGTYILLLATFYNLSLSKMAWMFFTWPYVAHSLFALFTGFALLRMKPYAWHAYVAHTIFVLVEQAHVSFRYAERPNVGIPLGVAMAVTLGLLWFLKRELRVPYFSPRIAWWESDPRYKISVPTQMTSADRLYQGEIMDVSATGCFIKIKAGFRVDQPITVKFSLFDRQFSCPGKVVWRTEGGVTHPKGVGVRFMALEKTVETDLRATVKKLRNLSMKYRELRKEEKASQIERKVDALLNGRKSG
ncbi:MAG: PilZ domain-containing protein [Bdellovibrionales bacterium]|nr:PilZ domain-containing protein [Bdellovibrionales bacterium]